MTFSERCALCRAHLFRRATPHAVEILGGPRDGEVLEVPCPARDSVTFLAMAEPVDAAWLADMSPVVDDLRVEHRYVAEPPDRYRYDGEYPH